MQVRDIALGVIKILVRADIDLDEFTQRKAVDVNIRQ